jgi:outer membrane protein OmpA-like peptidoglycan-associated protein
MNFFCAKLVVVVLILNAYAMGSVFETPIINRTGQVGVYDLSSAKSLGLTRLSVSLQTDFSYVPDYLVELIGKDSLFLPDTFSFEPMLFNIRPSFSFGVTRFLDISAVLPFHFDIMTTYNRGLNGIGDMELALKLVTPNSKQQMIHGGLLAKISFPTGKDHTGYFPRHTYYFDKSSVSDSITDDTLVSCFTSQKIENAFLALGTLEYKWFLLHLNGGLRITHNKKLDDALLMAAAIELHPSNAFAFFTEFATETRFYNVKRKFSIEDDPVRITPGITLASPAGATFTLAGSFSIASRDRNYNYYSFEKDLHFKTRIEPGWRVSMQFGWNGFLTIQDRDDDFVLDKFDRCPDEAEDLDAFEDSDGCPEYDNDNDGIPDTLDRCPRVPEDFDGFEDEDGCPDQDNDQDGVTDSVDNCINVAEDLDGFNDYDGCPEYDNDNDGVPDSLDKCMGLAEDRDGYEDTDGCPDIDNDLDGIPDSLDNCPDVAGVAEEKGCPRSKPMPKEIKRGGVILRGISFSGGSAELSSESFLILDQVIESLIAWSEIRIEIQSHTDDAGNDNINFSLSKRRADACRKYMISKGVAEDRIISAGKGETVPIAENSSIYGRQINNRIELHRVD